MTIGANLFGVHKSLLGIAGLQWLRTQAGGDEE
jgi:hypothetical protein